MDDINTPVIEEFRANGGAVDQAMGGFFKGKPLLILHHTGAKTGKLRMSPLVPFMTVATWSLQPRAVHRITPTGSSTSAPIRT